MELTFHGQSKAALKSIHRPDYTVKLVSSPAPRMKGSFCGYQSPIRFLVPMHWWGIARILWPNRQHVLWRWLEFNCQSFVMLIWSRISARYGFYPPVTNLVNSHVWLLWTYLRQGIVAKRCSKLDIEELEMFWVTNYVNRGIPMNAIRGLWLGESLTSRRIR